MEQGGRCSCRSWEVLQQAKSNGSIVVGRESGGAQGKDAAVSPSSELSDSSDGSRACSGGAWTAKNAME